MKLYCHIEKTISSEGAEILVIKQGPSELPQNTSTVSNLNLLDDETLKMFGWVPVEQITENKAVFVSVGYEIFEDRVIETTVTRDKTAEEINEDTEKQNLCTWQRIREQRDNLLLNSDKLVMVDRWERLTYEEKQTIAEYRQALRDLPSQTSDPALIIFPTL